MGPEEKGYAREISTLLMAASRIVLFRNETSTASKRGGGYVYVQAFFFFAESLTLSTEDVCYKGFCPVGRYVFYDTPPFQRGGEGKCYNRLVAWVGNWLFFLPFTSNSGV